MGGRDSRHERKRSSFNDIEQSYLEKHFANIINQKSLRFLTKTLYDKIYAHLRRRHKLVNGSKPFTYSSFEVFVDDGLRGTVTDKAGILFMLSDPKEHLVTAQNLYQTVYEFFLAFKAVISDLPQWKCWKMTDYKDVADNRFVLSLFNELYTKGASKKAEIPKLCVPVDGRYNVTDIEEWLTKTSMMIWILHIVFTNVFCIQEEKSRKEDLHVSIQIPLITESRILPVSTILDRNALVYLNNYNLPKHLTSEWRLLFCNSLYGDSFSQLVGHIVGQGPSLIVVKDKDGFIFGGFASHGWELRPKFYGSADSFLFTIAPQYGVFTTTGYNENYMYLNHGQATLPNGLGMGGQFDYFGFWIDNSFNNGHSKAEPRCTTYGSPQLSKFPHFIVEVVEVWGLGPKPKLIDSDEDEEQRPKSVLQDKETKAMLEILGKEQHSAGFKETDDDEEISKDMKRKMNTIPKML